MCTRSTINGAKTAILEILASTDAITMAALKHFYGRIGENDA